MLSSGGARAFLAPRPLIPPLELAPLRAVAPEAFGFGRRMPSAPSISLDPLEASAGGRPGEASSTAVGCGWSAAFGSSNGSRDCWTVSPDRWEREAYAPRGGGEKAGESTRRCLVSRAVRKGPLHFSSPVFGSLMRPLTPEVEDEQTEKHKSTPRR